MSIGYIMQSMYYAVVFLTNYLSRIRKKLGYKKIWNTNWDPFETRLVLSDVE